MKNIVSMNSTTDHCIFSAVSIIRGVHPNTQAIYLYGTWGTEYQRPNSDLDIAALLPHDEAKAVDPWKWHLFATDMAIKVHVGHVDLINLRCVDTSFQAEILSTGRLIYCTDEEVRLQFETLVLSMHQRLNEERAGIREEIIKSGRVYAV